MGMPATDTPAGLMTAEELERVSIPGKVTELIRGRLVVRQPPSTLHGRVSARLAYYLGAFVYPQALGEIFAQDTGFKIESKPDTVRAPDVAFLVRERAADIPARGYAALAPDLAVEVRPTTGPANSWAKSRPGWMPARASCGSSIPNGARPGCTGPTER
jgi:Uma2 family endonuclease